MFEIECPYCGKVTQIKGGEVEEQTGSVREALERGERPKLACFECWREHEMTSIPQPGLN
jgi:hypothetical protein